MMIWQTLLSGKPALRAVTGLILWLGLSCAPTVAWSDETLTLELPPSQNAVNARAMHSAHDPMSAVHASSTMFSPAYSRPPKMHRSPTVRRGNYPSRGRGESERVVGRLGLLAQQTPIYREDSSRAPLLISAAPGTYLAIQSERRDWYGVLMVDGSIGWLRKRSVRLLDYQVVSTGAPAAPPMPSGLDPGDIYPHGNTPFFNGDAQTLLNAAYRYMGVRYVWGGNTASGIDCSGFVKNVFASCGYPLPRLGSDQMAYGIPVPIDQLQPGDRLYFGRRKERLGVTHTGLYIGGGYFIHSSSSRHGVAVSRLDEPMFARIYVCARR